MSLKPKKSQLSDPVSSDKPAPLSGPWGRINSSPGSVEVIRFCQGSTPANQRTHSYPYRVLSSWHWSQNGNEEELNVNAGADVITVRGRGLDRLTEALDRGSLEMMAEAREEELELEQSPIFVSSIGISVSEEKQ